MDEYKVVDYFNGWESHRMTHDQAKAYILANPSPTPRGVELAEAVWEYDPRFSEWAWFIEGNRVS